MPSAYLTRSEADLRMEAFGARAWFEAEDSAKDAALARASAYIDRRYAGRWKGVRALVEQDRAWPRLGATDGDGYEVDAASIPEAVKEATAEAALALIQGVILEARPGDPTPLIRKRVKAEGVETEKEYAEPSKGSGAYAFVAVDAALSGLLLPARSSSGFLLRA